ncbi:hypothetical protein [Pseudoroseicyclus aestuarii]|uniref:Uncharacterized protein n=1 Tax=Pseudoroseicyclus aestuarii TaxID=1795041 RepID=A0A318T4A5_9RHOB|nr:hypothetical protein [Pseudoroseicyclus aestuarii]PYE81348.1 hypothetical protein DFP88_10626 [Pseudoroseicyclus aestuarii]
MSFSLKLESVNRRTDRAVFRLMDGPLGNRRVVSVEIPVPAEARGRPDREIIEMLEPELEHTLRQALNRVLRD